MAREFLPRMAQLSWEPSVFGSESKLPEDAPNPAVGALLGSATGTLEAGPRRG
jgi:hypothetical protein